jgi:hypothetical protein
MKDLDTNSHTDPESGSLNHSVDAYRDIDDVLSDNSLSTQMKRELLASWASDAVPHVPWLRQLPDGSLVNVSEILRALKTLDLADAATATPDGRDSLWNLPFKRRRRTSVRGGNHIRPWNDDDDDPPPCPAYAARSPRSGGGASMVFPELVPA